MRWIGLAALRSSRAASGAIQVTDPAAARAVALLRCTRFPLLDEQDRHDVTERQGQMVFDGRMLRPNG